MLALETTHSWGWALDVTVGAATETYTNAVTDSDAATSVQALVDWLNAPGRAWFATRAFAWTWARQASTGAAILTLTATGGTFSINAGALATLGFAAAAGVTSVTGSAAVGTWAPVSGVSVRRDFRLLSEGDAGGNGAVRPGVPGLACRAPRLEAVGTATDAARLAAVLATASSPRRAMLWQVHTGSWVEVALGPVSRSPQGTLHYQFTFDVAGDAV